MTEDQVIEVENELKWRLADSGIGLRRTTTFASEHRGIAYHSWVAFHPVSASWETTPGVSSRIDIQDESMDLASPTEIARAYASRIAPSFMELYRKNWLEGHKPEAREPSEELEALVV